jgi:membrane protease YdiL (CAAX protease family)
MQKVGTAPAEPGSERLGLLIAGFLAVFVVFDRAGASLQSGRGERGWILCALVVALVWSLEVVLYRRSAGDAFRALGLGIGSPRGLLAAAAVVALLLLYFPLLAPVPLRGDWLKLLPGLFAQHGIAEEVLFRGFLFHHLRARRSFSRAALLSMLLFVAAHLYLFTYMDPAIALASTLLAAATAWPLAWLFELGSRTVWAPALLHTGIHAIKLVEVPESSYSVTLGWMAVSAVVPWMVFLVRRPETAKR